MTNFSAWMYSGALPMNVVGLVNVGDLRAVVILLKLEGWRHQVGSLERSGGLP